MPTRRDVLRSVGATAAAGVGLAATSAPVRAAHDDAQPDHVTIDFPTSDMSRYAPELVMSDDARAKFLGLYGWRASSPEYDTDIYVYWASYSHQDGFIGNLDSHRGDHEPIQVLVNSTTREVEKIRASVYHWIKGEAFAADFALADETHPRLRVIDPWHQYTAVDEGRGGFVPEVADLRDEWDSWLANGLEGSVAPGSSVNPWIMSTRSDWWRRSDTLRISTDAAIVHAMQPVLGTTGSLET